jgi:hypothetical protein
MAEAGSPNSSVAVDIPLADMIQALRRELNAARSGAIGEDLKFEVEKVDIELQVAVTRDANVKTGVKFWVVNAEGELARSRNTTHTFKLALNPVSTVSGGRVQVAGQPKEDISPH